MYSGTGQYITLFRQASAAADGGSRQSRFTKITLPSLHHCRRRGNDGQAALKALKRDCPVPRTVHTPDQASRW